VDESVGSEYKPKLLELITPYEPKNIYIADETGLFLRPLPTKLLVLKGEKCTGAKMSKERLTVLLCGRNGKAAKPRRFKSLKINDLPVIWRNNEKALMTVATMEEWLNNAKMKEENRNAILFLDYAACHPKVTLSM
jgi:hypothetical protein